MNPPVVIATTFREFDGSDNDTIQRLFLEGLKRQTYSNWQLAVTTFREERVADVIQSLNIPHTLFRGEPAPGHRFSLSDVVANALEGPARARGSVLLWTTCDVLFEPSFLEVAVRNLKPLSCLTSSPHMIYASLADYFEGLKPRYFFEGLDFLMIDAQLLRFQDAQSALSRYRFHDWGVFEFFLESVAGLNAASMTNLWPEIRVSKIENDRDVGAETFHRLHHSLQRNRRLLRQFASEFGVKLRFPVGFTEVAKFRVMHGRTRHLVWHAAASARFAWQTVRQRLRLARQS